MKPSDILRCISCRTALVERKSRIVSKIAKFVGKERFHRFWSPFEERWIGCENWHDRSGRVVGAKFTCAGDKNTSLLNLALHKHGPGVCNKLLLSRLQAVRLFRVCFSLKISATNCKDGLTAARAPRTPALLNSFSHTVTSVGPSS